MDGNRKCENDVSGKAPEQDQDRYCLR